MALNLATTVKDFLASHPDQKFPARKIAEWILKSFPDECQRKKAANDVIRTDTDLRNLPVMELNESSIPSTDNLRKKNKMHKTTLKGGFLAFLFLAGCSSESVHAPSLHAAARDGDTRKVSEMIAAGADIHEQDAEGYTPLHYAAGHGKTRAMRKLMDAGADIDAKAKHGAPPLYGAAKWGHVDAVNMLVDAKADVNLTGYSNQTPLHAAVLISPDKKRIHSSWSQEQIINKLIVDGGATVDARDRFRYTPLHYAAINSYPKAVGNLIKKGAKVNAIHPRTEATTLGLVSIFRKRGRREIEKDRQRVIDILKANGAY